MIALVLPTNRGLLPKTLESLLRMIKRTSVVPIIATEGFNTAENRTWLAARAVKEGCSHIFFADDDMIYEEDTLEKLRAKDRDIVGAKYANRRGSGEVIEYLEKKQEGELIEVNALGGGCVLIKADVFKNIPQPWFWYEINNNGSVKMSHDWFFCKKARECGYKIWCDLSVKPKHISTHEY